MQGFRLSPQQRRLWRLTQQGHPARAALLLALDGGLDRERLRAALGRVTERHEILRTEVRRPAGRRQPVQVVLPDAAPAWQVRDLTELSPGEAGRQVARLFEDELGRMGQEGEPPVSAILLELPEGPPELLLSLSALLTDEATLLLLAEETAAAYGAPAEEAGEAVQYADVAEVFNELLEDPDSAPGRALWEEASSRLVPRAPLPDERGGEGLPERARADLRLPGAPGEALLLAAWAVLIGRLTGRDAVSIGVLRHGRTEQAFARALGPFARSLPVTVEVSGERTFAAVAAELAERLAELDRWQDCHDREESFDLLFSLGDGARAATAGGVIFAPRRWQVLGEPGLSLAVEPAGDGFRSAVCDSAGRLSAAALEALLGRYGRLVEAASAAPDVAAGTASLVDPAERARELARADGPRVDLPAEETVDSLLAEVAAARPEAWAVVCRDRRLTYGELEGRLGALARILARHGVGRGDVVVVFLDRSVDLVVALWAALRAGAAYAVITPDEPPLRLAAKLAELGRPLVVTEERYAGLLPAAEERVLCLDGERPGLAGGAPAPPPAAGPGDLAYVCYTSGSTGRPKGVAIEHRALLNYARFIRASLLDGLAAEGEQLQIATVSTPAADLGNTALFPALVSGACLHLADYRLSTDGTAFAAWVEQEGIDVLKIVPSHLKALLATGAAALPRRLVILGGEALPPALVRQIRAAAPGCRVVNHYGPTETTVGSLVFPVEDLAAGAASVPVGRPIANLCYRILDRAAEWVPAGAPGELHLGGIGLARGYLGQPGQTAERFVPDPWAPAPGERLYRTGDWVRRLLSGALEFLGRVDHQVKIRGFRVEPQEVAALLVAHPEVRGAVVAPRALEAAGGELRLVAWVVPAPGAAAHRGELRRFLAERLPEPMLPAAFLTVDALPLTANGKVDFARLPEPDLYSQASGGEHVAPRTPSEKRLAEAWRHALGVERVGVYDNFFELGGDSILAIQIAAKSRQEGVALEPVDFFRHPTLEQLAAVAAAKATTAEAPAPRQPQQPRHGLDEATLGKILAQVGTVEP